MGAGTQGVKVNENRYIGFKISNSGIDDNDINKPVKLTASDTVTLCSDGDQIYGWVSSVEKHTVDGKVWVGIQTEGRKWCTLSGTSAIGDLVEAGANTAAGVVLAGDWGVVSTHVLDTTSAVTLAAGLLDKKWKIISGTFADGDEVLIEKQ